MRRITLGILTGMLACATVQAVQITDDFESYTPGAWNTTEMAAMGWAYYDAFQNPVIGVGYSISGQGMRYNASNDALPIWGQAANGKGRVDATHNTITYWLNVVTCNNFYKLGHWNEGNGTLSSVDLKADWSVKLDTASGAFTLGAWESGSWLKIDLEFDLSGNQVRGRMNNGTWSAYGAFHGSRTATYVKTYVLGRSSDVYADEWAVPMTEEFPSVLEDFETYTPGAWNTTEMDGRGWAFYDPNQDGTVGAAYGRTGQGLLYDASNDALPVWGRGANAVGRIGVLADSVTHFINIQANNNFAKLGLWNHNTETLGSVILRSTGEVELEVTEGYLPLGTWTAGEWLQLNLEYNFGSNQVRGSIRRDGWSSWGTFLGGRSASWVQTYFLARSSTVWLDDWSLPSVDFPAQGGTVIVIR